jgi:hypothetical protein
MCNVDNKKIQEMVKISVYTQKVKKSGNLVKTCLFNCVVILR